jgi:hypothetical protein
MEALTLPADESATTLNPSPNYAQHLLAVGQQLDSERLRYVTIVELEG